MRHGLAPPLQGSRRLPSGSPGSSSQQVACATSRSGCDSTRLAARSRRRGALRIDGPDTVWSWTANAGRDLSRLAPTSVRLVLAARDRSVQILANRRRCGVVLQRLLEFVDCRVEKPTAC